jgi:CheY-like chemotaxis protein
VLGVKSVLVADDEFGILMVLEMVLEDAGYQVLTAGNGRQALEIASAERPDLIFLDWMMPIMDGPSTAMAMRQVPRLANTPIVIMSGAPESSLKTRFTDYVAFLRKPFRDSDVMHALEQVMGSKT